MTTVQLMKNAAVPPAGRNATKVQNARAAEQNKPQCPMRKLTMSGSVDGVAFEAALPMKTTVGLGLTAGAGVVALGAGAVALGGMGGKVALVALAVGGLGALAGGIAYRDLIGNVAMGRVKLGVKP